MAGLVPAIVFLLYFLARGATRQISQAGIGIGGLWRLTPRPRAYFFWHRQPMTKYWLLLFCHSSALSPAVLRQLTTSSAVAPGTGVSLHFSGVAKRQTRTTSWAMDARVPPDGLAKPRRHSVASKWR